MDNFQKKLIKVSPTPPKKSKLDDSIIFETYFQNVLENKKSDNDKLNARVLDYFLTSQN